MMISWKIKWLMFSMASLMLWGNAANWAQAQRETFRPVTTQNQPTMSTKVYEKVSPATVNITLDYGKKNKNGSGSIIGISPTGLAVILTACHVIVSNFDESDPETVPEFHKDILIKSTTELKPLRARVFPEYVDIKNDLALIVTYVPISKYRIISYARTDKISPGLKVAAFGYPKGDKLSQTVGNITRDETNYLVFDARITLGNSGGPLVDEAGRMIGMSTKKDGDEGYAIKMNLIVSIVDDWLKNINLHKRWKREKYTSRLERTYKDWRFVVGETLLLNGGLFFSGVLKDKPTAKKNDPGFVMPPGRP